MTGKMRAELSQMVGSSAYEQRKASNERGYDSVLLTFFFTNFTRRDHAAVMKLEDEPEEHA